MSATVDREALKRMTDDLIGQGRIIEAGWQSLRIMAIPSNAPDIQIREMRNAFFAGAQHLYASIMETLDPGSEPTDADLARMGKIDDELNAFAEELKRRLKTEGSA